MPETKSEVLARLLTNGGTILCVGGNVTQYLPDRLRNHAQIRCWDDEKQDWSKKSVPSNTRAILVNRWVGHSQIWQLRRDAEALKIPLFFPLRSREMKDIIQEALTIETARVEQHTPANMDVAVEAFSPAPIQASHMEHEETAPQTEPTTQADTAMMGVQELEKGFLTKDEMMRKPKRGELKAFLLKHANFHAPSVRKEAERLLKMLKDEGITTTLMTVENLFYFARKHGDQPSHRKPRATQDVQQAVAANRAPRAKQTETAVESEMLQMLYEGERLLNDAKSAMDLLAEFMPKLKTAVEKHYSGMAKLREFLGV